MQIYLPNDASHQTERFTSNLYENEQSVFLLVIGNRRACWPISNFREENASMIMMMDGGGCWKKGDGKLEV